MITIVIILAIILFIFLFLLWLFPLIEVCGDSMYPTLHDGEHIIGKRLFRKNTKTLELDEIYVYKPPMGDSKYVIKRLHDRGRNDNELYFMGDNQEVSYDSRSYGYVHPKKVVAKVIYRK